MLNQEIVSFGRSVRAVWLPSGVGSQKRPAPPFPFSLYGPGSFPFSLLERRSFPSPFPHPPNFLSNFSWAYRYNIFIISTWQLVNIPISHYQNEPSPQVVLRCEPAEIKMGSRIGGSSTRSRLAGALGRMPVEAVIAKRADHCGCLGVNVDRTT